MSFYWLLYTCADSTKTLDLDFNLNLKSLLGTSTTTSAAIHDVVISMNSLFGNARFRRTLPTLPVARWLAYCSSRALPLSLHFTTKSMSHLLQPWYWCQQLCPHLLVWEPGWGFVQWPRLFLVLPCSHDSLPQIFYTLYITSWKCFWDTWS